jgi:hypothetical protein
VCGKPDDRLLDAVNMGLVECRGCVLDGDPIPTHVCRECKHDWTSTGENQIGVVLEAQARELLDGFRRDVLHGVENDREWAVALAQSLKQVGASRRKGRDETGTGWRTLLQREAGLDRALRNLQLGVWTHCGAINLQVIGDKWKSPVWPTHDAVIVLEKFVWSIKEPYAELIYVSGLLAAAVGGRDTQTVFNLSSAYADAKADLEASVERFVEEVWQACWPHDDLMPYGIK